MRGDTGQDFGLGQVGGDEICARDQPRFQGLQPGLIQQGMAAG